MTLRIRQTTNHQSTQSHTGPYGSIVFKVIALFTRVLFPCTWMALHAVMIAQVLSKCHQTGNYICVLIWHSHSPHFTVKKSVMLATDTYCMHDLINFSTQLMDLNCSQKPEEKNVSHSSFVVNNATLSCSQSISLFASTWTQMTWMTATEPDEHHAECSTVKWTSSPRGWPLYPTCHTLLIINSLIQQMRRKLLFQQVVHCH